MRPVYAVLATAWLCAHPVTAQARGQAPQARQSASAPAELHPSLVARAMRDLGRGNFTGISQWCAAAVSVWLRGVGLPPLANNMASSALTYGPHLAAPKPGALVVMARHVGLVESVNADGSIMMLSGNWSSRVREARIDRRLVVAFVSVN